MIKSTIIPFHYVEQLFHRVNRGCKTPSVFHYPEGNVMHSTRHNCHPESIPPFDEVVPSVLSPRPPGFPFSDMAHNIYQSSWVPRADQYRLISKNNVNFFFGLGVVNPIIYLLAIKFFGSGNHSTDLPALAGSKTTHDNVTQGIVTGIFAQKQTNCVVPVFSFLAHVLRKAYCTVNKFIGFSSFSRAEQFSENNEQTLNISRDHSAPIQIKKIRLIASSSFIPLLISFASLLFLAGNAFAQYQVFDATNNAAINNLTSQTASNQTSILQQWTTSFGKLDSQIAKLNSLVQVAGNPQAALGAIGGTGNLGSIGTTLSQAGQLGNQIMQTANGGRSLLSNGQGAFQSIPSTLSNGSIIPRNTTAYNKFDAYEQNFNQLNTTLQQCQTTRQNLLSELQSTLAASPGDASQQQAQLIKINAINGQLLANDQMMKQIQSQTTAQSEANLQDTEKQRQALAETIYAQDQQMSAQGAAYRKNLLNNQ